MRQFSAYFLGLVDQTSRLLVVRPRHQASYKSSHDGHERSRQALERNSPHNSIKYTEPVAGFEEMDSAYIPVLTVESCQGLHLG